MRTIIDFYEGQPNQWKIKAHTRLNDFIEKLASYDCSPFAELHKEIKGYSEDELIEYFCTLYRLHTKLSKKNDDLQKQNDKLTEQLQHLYNAL